MTRRLRSASVNGSWAVALGLVLAAVAASAPGAPAQEADGYADYPMTVRYDVGIPAGGGVELSADIYRPRTDGPVPTIFSLTPYNNNSDRSMDAAWSWVSRGYAFVSVDARGRFDSEGAFDPFRNDGADGDRILGWIAERGWSNGEVATYGGSYLGGVQWLMAREDNPAHAAALSYVAPADGFLDLVRYNGVPKVDLIYTWAMGMDGRVNQSRAGWDWAEAMWKLPLDSLDRVVGRDVEYWQSWMREDSLNGYWSAMHTSGSYGDFDVPSFNVTGWWDGQLRGATTHYRNAARTGDPSDHMLIIGPWEHGVNARRELGERDYGRQAIIPLDSVRNAWVDHRLLGTTDPGLPRVAYFVPVSNRWRTADAWPVPGTEFTDFYLDSDGEANTLFGNGKLQSREPGTGTDSFQYDPADPVPTVSSRTAGARGGIAHGSVDNRAVETREDVLVYTTEPLSEGMTVAGPITATIYVSTDVPDTDVTVKLLDVYPDGRALNISHGIARTRYRESYGSPRLLEEEEVYPIEVELYPGANHFAAGHRIRVEVSSSNFPNFGRNLNIAASPNTSTRMQVANTEVHHSSEHPSHVRLPVVPDTAGGTWLPLGGS